ncbi:MAG: hypothetical protein KKA28_16220, partial [Planctomycetes bacterium]|nr:hypothetical protein [Planctomycetota bacterium]
GSWQSASGTTSWNRSVSLSSGSNTIEARSRDGAGNYSTIPSVSVTYNPPDTTSPTVTINQASGQTDPTSSSPINFTVVFSETVTDFATGDVTLNGTAGTTTATVTGSGTTYNVAVSGMTGDGTVIASIVAAKAHDAAGNPNTASTSTDNTVQYTATPAGPTISAVLVVEAMGPRDGTLTTSESLLMTFNAVDPDGVASATVQVDGQNVTPAYGPYAAASGVNFAAPLGTLSAGAHNYSIVATDNAGNPTSPAYTGTFDVLPTTGPTISHVVVAEAGTAKNGTLESSDKLLITWSATRFNGIASKSLTVDGQAVSTIYGPYGDNYAGVFGPLAAGQHTFTIEVTDANGIASTHNGTFNVAAAPVLEPKISNVVVAEAGTGGNRNGTLESSDKLVITWSATSDDGIASKSLTVDGQAVSTVYGPYGVNYAGVFGPLAAGQHSFTIETTDFNGVRSEYSGTFNVEAAAAAPRIGNVVVAEAGTDKNGTLESSDKLVITWSATSDDGIASKSLTVDGQAVSTVYGPYGVNYAGVFGPLTGGTHAYTIEVTDANGIASTHNGTFNVIAAASVAPQIGNVVVAETANLARDGLLNTEETLVLTWTLTDADGIASKSLAVDGNAVATIYGPYGNAYAGLLGQLTAGTHAYAIQATDTTGQTSMLNGTFSVLAALTLEASAAPTGSADALTDAELASITAEAAHRLEALLGSRGSTALSGVSIQVADLPGNLLGATTDGKILIDHDAAGYGWFVDPTPGDDEEFIGDNLGPLLARQNTVADGRADLLTTVMHEMGHILGYNHADEGLMDDLLPLGARRTAATDKVFAGYGQ